MPISLIFGSIFVGGVLLLWATFSTWPAHAYGRPVTEPTNVVWACGYPYPHGYCAAKLKDK